MMKTPMRYWKSLLLLCCVQFNIGLLFLRGNVHAFQEWIAACPPNIPGSPLVCDDAMVFLNSTMQLSCELLLDELRMSEEEVVNSPSTARIISIIDPDGNFTLCVDSARVLGSLIDLIETLVDIGLDNEIGSAIPEDFTSFLDRSANRIAAVRIEDRWSFLFESDDAIPIGTATIQSLNSMPVQLNKVALYLWQELRPSSTTEEDSRVRQVTGHGTAADTDVILVFSPNKPLYIRSKTVLQSQPSTISIADLEDELGFPFLPVVPLSSLPFPVEIDIGIISMSLHLWIPVSDDSDIYDSILMVQGQLDQQRIEITYSRGEGALSTKLPSFKQIFQRTVGDIGNAADIIESLGGLSDALAIYISDIKALDGSLAERGRTTEQQLALENSLLLGNRIVHSIEQAMMQVAAQDDDVVVVCIPFTSPTSCASDPLCQILFGLLQSIRNLDLCGAFAMGAGADNLYLAASLGQSITLGPIRLDDPSLFISFDPDDGTDSLSFGFAASTLIRVNGGQELELSGSIFMGTSSFSAQLAFIGQWQEPFGFDFLTIQDLFLRGDVPVDLSGFTPSFGGTVILGQTNAVAPPNGTACMGLDPNVPNRNWFFFRIESLGLTDLFSLFLEIATVGAAPTIPLPSIFDEFATLRRVEVAWIPPLISGLSSASPPICIFDGRVVSLRGAFGEGFTFYGEITLLGWELLAEARLELAAGGRPRKAHFSMESPNVLTIGPNLILMKRSLADPGANLGPIMSLTVDFASAASSTETYVEGAIEVPALRTAAEFRAQITRDRLHTEFSAIILDLFRANVRVIIRDLDKANPKVDVRPDALPGEPILDTLGEFGKQVIDDIDNAVNNAIEPLKQNLAMTRDALVSAAQEVADASRLREHFLKLRDQARNELEKLGQRLDELRDLLGSLCPPKRDCPTICDHVKTVCEIVGKVIDAIFGGRTSKKVCEVVCAGEEFPDPVCQVEQFICYGSIRRERRFLEEASGFMYRPRTLAESELERAKEEYDITLNQYKNAQAAVNRQGQRFAHWNSEYTNAYRNMVERIRPVSNARRAVNDFESSLPGKALDFLADRKNLGVRVHGLALVMPITSSQLAGLGRFSSRVDLKALGMRGSLDGEVDLGNYQGTMSAQLDDLTSGEFGGQRFSDSSEEAKREREKFDRDRGPPTTPTSIDLDAFDQIDFDIPPPVPLQSDRRLPDLPEIQCIDTDGLSGVYPSYTLSLELMIILHISSEYDEYGTIWTMGDASESEDGTAMRLRTTRTIDYEHAIAVIEFISPNTEASLSTELLEPYRWYTILVLIEQDGATLWVDSEPVASTSVEYFPWYAGNNGLLCWKPACLDRNDPKCTAMNQPHRTFIVAEAEPTRNVGVVASLDIKASNPNAAQLSPFISSLRPHLVLNSDNTRLHEVLIRGSQVLSSSSTLSFWLRLDYFSEFATFTDLFYDRRRSYVVRVNPSSRTVQYVNGAMLLEKRISLRGWHLFCITLHGNTVTLHVNGWYYDSDYRSGLQSTPSYKDGSEPVINYDILAGPAFGFWFVQMTELNYRNDALERLQMLPSHALEWWPSQRPVIMSIPPQRRNSNFYETENYEYLLVSSSGLESGYTWGQAQDECKRRFSSGSDLAWSLHDDALDLREEWLNNIDGSLWIGLRQLDVGWTFVDGTGASPPDTIENGNIYCTVLRWNSEGSSELAGLDCFERRSHFVCQRNPRHVLARRENVPSSDAYTWSFFIKMTSTATQDTVVWSTKGPGQRLVLESNSTRVKWSLDSEEEGKESSYNITAPDIPLGQFVQVTLVIRVNRLKLYIDGELVKYEESPQGLQDIQIEDDLVFGTAPVLVRHIKYWPTDLFQEDVAALLRHQVGIVDSHLIHEPFRGPVSRENVRVTPSQTRVLSFWARFAGPLLFDTSEYREVPFLQQGDDQEWQQEASLAISFVFVASENNEAGAGVPVLRIYLGNGLSMDCPTLPNLSMERGLSTRLHFYISPGHSTYVYYNENLRCHLEHPLIVGLDERPLYYNTYMPLPRNSSLPARTVPPPVLWDVQVSGNPFSLAALTLATSIVDQVRGDKPFATIKPFFDFPHYQRLPRFPGTISFRLTVSDSFRTTRNNFNMDWDTPSGDLFFRIMIQGYFSTTPRMVLSICWQREEGSSSFDCLETGIDTASEEHPLLGLEIGVSYHFHFVVGYDYFLLLRDGQMAFNSKTSSRNTHFVMSNVGKVSEYGMTAFRYTVYAGVSISQVEYIAEPLADGEGVLNWPLYQALSTRSIVGDPVSLDAVVPYWDWHKFTSESFVLSWWQKALEKEPLLEFPLKRACAKWQVDSGTFSTPLLPAVHPNTWHFVEVTKIDSQSPLTVTLDGQSVDQQSILLPSDCHVLDASLTNSSVAYIEIMEPLSSLMPSLMGNQQGLNPPESHCADLSSSRYISSVARLPTSSFRLSMNATFVSPPAWESMNNDGNRGISRPLLCRSQHPSFGLSLFPAPLVYPQITQRKQSHGAVEVAVFLSDDVNMSFRPNTTAGDGGRLEIVVGQGAAELWFEGELVDRTKFVFQGPFPTSLLSISCEKAIILEGSYNLISQDDLLCVDGIGNTLSTLGYENCSVVNWRIESDAVWSIGTLQLDSDLVTATQTDVILGRSSQEDGHGNLTDDLRWSVVVVGASGPSGPKVLIQNVFTGECMVNIHGRLRMTPCSLAQTNQIFVIHSTDGPFESHGISVRLSDVKYCPFGHVTTTPQIETVLIDQEPSPSLAPSIAISDAPTQPPTQPPTYSPTPLPTESPSLEPSMIAVNFAPSQLPTHSATPIPTESPSLEPSNAIDVAPTFTPSSSPTSIPISFAALSTLIQSRSPSISFAVGSPQWSALLWLFLDEYAQSNLQGNDDRLVQRFALATHYYTNDEIPGWLEPTPECEWTFSSTSACSSDGLLLQIKLWNDATGRIASELGLLTSLEEIDFWSNDHTGKIPTELALLTQLTELGLSNNKLTGAIPPDLGRLSKLRWLQLSFNDLSGTIPAELGLLTELRALSLAGNELTGPFPSELSSLTRLHGMTLYGNSLSGTIPETLCSNPLLVDDIHIDCGEISCACCVDEDVFADPPNQCPAPSPTP